jgi:hypothetical protein
MVNEAETSVHFQHAKRRYVPQHRTFDNQRCEVVKSYIRVCNPTYHGLHIYSRCSEFVPDMWNHSIVFTSVNMNLSITQFR